MSKPEKEQVKFVDYSAKLEEAILSVEIMGKQQRHKIHNVALSIVQAWGKGQLTEQQPAMYFNKLVAASGYHGKALANWISLKLPLKFSDDNEQWYVPVDAKVNGDTFKEARDEPFWEVSPPPKAVPFDATALLMALLERNQKKVADPSKQKEGDVLLTTDQVKGIRALLAG